MFDIIITNGKLVNGTGNPWFKADIGIKNQKIAKIGRLKNAEAAKTIDATGLIVCPGFIDIHSHSDKSAPFLPRQESAIAQGITTHIVGNCGNSPAPIVPGKEDLLIKHVWGELPEDQRSMIDWTTFNDYLNREEGNIAGNMIHLVGHSTLRVMGMGFDARAPKTEEMEEMKRLAAEAMEAGAIGLSTGLLYPPGSFANIEELIELSKVISQYEGFYFTHVRSYSDELAISLREALEIGEKANVAVQLSHISVFGPSNWGRSEEVLELVEEARAKGQEVSMDLHPYDSVGTTLIILLPPWTHDGGTPKMLARLKDPNERIRIIQDMEQGHPDWSEWLPPEIRKWENILIAKVRTEQNKPLEGKSLKEIAELRKVDEFTALFDLLIEEEGEVSIVGTKMRSEEDIIAFMKCPLSSFETDAGSIAPSEGGKPHPRTYGTYPKILGEFVREKQVLSFETAIRKMTALPAQSVRLWNRGLLRAGMYSDIVLFNPNTVIDKATYADPHQYGEGIEFVMVNGTIVFQNGEHTGALPGKVLRFKNGQTS